MRAALRPVVAALLVALAAAGRAAAAPPLPALAIDTTAISVSGVSSGGFMANQLQVAYSATISGVGVIAAGPYGCAGGGFPWNLWRAMNVCSDFEDGLPFAGPPALARSLEFLHQAAARAGIDDPRHLARARVYVFSGQLDRTVPPSVVQVTEAFYRAFLTEGERIHLEATIPAAHSMVTFDFGNACAVSKPPFLSDCDFSLAAAVLAHIYGELAPPAASAATAGRLRSFDQRPFVGDRQPAGLGDVGYVYVPAACEGAAGGCRLHVALHGCQQSASEIGETFVRHAGYNEIAETNRIVVLYPQAVPTTLSWFGLSLPWPNPKGCWDWWGFTGANYAERQGPQPRAIKAMIDHLASPVR